MGLWPQHMCCAPMYICIPIYPIDNAQGKGSKVRTGGSESVRVDQRTSRTLRTMRMKTQKCLGARGDNIRAGEQGNTCGFLYCKDRSTGTALKQVHIKFQGGVSPQVPVQFSRT